MARPLLRLNCRWQAESRTTRQLAPRGLPHKEVDRIESWDVWNAQATWTSADNAWYVRAYGKNLADEDHLVGQYLTDATSGNFTNVFAIEPRTYGIAVGYNFNAQ